MSHQSPKKSASADESATSTKKSSHDFTIFNPTTSLKAKDSDSDKREQAHPEEQPHETSQHCLSPSETSKCDTSESGQSKQASATKIHDSNSSPATVGGGGGRGDASSLSASFFGELPSLYNRDESRLYGLYLSATSTSLGASYSNLSSALSPDTGSIIHEAKKQHSTQPLSPTTTTSSYPMSFVDGNNNKNNNSTNNNSSSSTCAAKDRDLAQLKKSNFSKSASGSKLVSRSRPNVSSESSSSPPQGACETNDNTDSTDKSSNRRKFIEHYYTSKTLLPSELSSSSSFSINNPFNRLNECDAITKRLLSSPIRRNNPCESPTNQSQSVSAAEHCTSTRRASLGADTITDQKYTSSFSSNPFKSLDTRNQSCQRPQQQAKLQQQQPQRHHHHHHYLGNVSTSSSLNQADNNNEVKLKQQQGRSLSVCNEETLHPKRVSCIDHSSSNLGRAISLACAPEPKTTTRRYTIIPLFGCDITSLEQFWFQFGFILPPVIDSAINHIIAKGAYSMGIFRKSGVKSRIMLLKKRIEENQNVEFNDLIRDTEFSIYDIADLIKMWFRELKPVPLVSRDLIKLISAFLSMSLLSESGGKSQALLQRKRDRTNYSSQDTSTTSSFSMSTTTAATTMMGLSQQCSNDSNLKSRIDSLTSPLQRALLFRVLNFLAQISSKCQQNQMTSQNLAICLTPSLCATESDQNSMTLAQRVLEYCIDNHQRLFS